MADKLMYIPNYITIRLDSQLNELANQNSINVPKVVKPTNDKKTVL